MKSSSTATIFLLYALLFSSVSADIILKPAPTKKVAPASLSPLGQIGLSSTLSGHYVAADVQTKADMDVQFSIDGLKDKVLLNLDDSFIVVEAECASDSVKIVVEDVGVIKKWPESVVVYTGTKSESCAVTKNPIRIAKRSEATVDANTKTVVLKTTPTTLKDQGGEFKIDVELSKKSNEPKADAFWLDLPVCYEPSRKATCKPDMPLWKDGPMAVYCENCWANVRVGIKTSITGSFWRGYETTSTILGRVDVNADFKAVLGQGLRKNFNLDLDLTPLVEKVLPGFTLPGIISVGPELLLGASLDINGNIGATARLGFDASVSYGTLNVNELMKTQQVAPKNWDAQFNIHQPRVEVAEAAVTLTANVVPEVGLRLWLLETYRENVGVYTDVNGVAKLTAAGSNNPYSCPREAIGYEISSGLGLGVKFRGQKRVVMQRPILPLDCPFCKGCIQLM